MSERLPYEDSFKEEMNNLPLPDEDKAWDKMKLLLQEDDDDKVVPPIFLRSCLGGILLVALVLAGLWFFFRPDKWWLKKETSSVKTGQPPVRTATPFTGNQDTVTRNNDKSGNDNTSVKEHSNNNFNDTSSYRSDHTNAAFTAEQPESKETGIIKRGRKSFSSATSSINARKTGTKKFNTANTARQKEKQHANTVVPLIAATQAPSSRNTQTDLPGNNAINKEIEHQPDSLSKPKDAVILKNEPEDSVVSTKQKAIRKNRYYFSAGLGLQQQIPFGGQKTTPYDYYGRKGSPADYLPSAYLRMHRQNKWFLQAEFRYGAPMAVKELAYDQNIVTDSLQTNVTTTTLRVKKTFYHQLPLSFNYQVFPAFTLGAGLMYSKFYGAVVEEEVAHKNYITGAQSSVKTIFDIHPGNDSLYHNSNFTSSQVSFLINADYQWRRLGFSLRYTRGFTPYIKYSDPAGIPKDEKGQSLQFIVRFRLWQSRR